MAHSVIQTRRFARQYKKLDDNAAKYVDDAVGIISKKPSIGQRKKGDLATLLVYKFKCNDQLYLLGYSLDEGLRLIYLEAIGSHENFYRDFKR